ncbi:MAG: hypothetical protein WBO35_02765 [Candidatus Saccharimonadales bacterium]
MPDYRSNALFSDVEPSYLAEDVSMPAQDVAGVALDAVFITHEPPQKNFLDTVSTKLETQQAAVSGANYLETPFSDKQVVETCAPKGSIPLTNFTHS